MTFSRAQMILAIIVSCTLSATLTTVTLTWVQGDLLGCPQIVQNLQEERRVLVQKGRTRSSTDTGNSIVPRALTEQEAAGPQGQVQRCWVKPPVRGQPSTLSVIQPDTGEDGHHDIVDPQKRHKNDVGGDHENKEANADENHQNNTRRSDASSEVSLLSSSPQAGTTSAPTFIYTVLTTHIHHNTHVKAIKETWGRHVDIAFFGSDRAGPEGSKIREVSLTPAPIDDIRKEMEKLAAEEDKDDEGGRSQLGRKAMMMLLILGKENPNKDFYVMTDDDTFVLAHNLEGIMGAHFNSSRDLYAGYTLTHTKPTIVGGGGGIVLTRATMQKLIRRSESPTSVCNPSRVSANAGDTAILYCMREMGVAATYQPGFNPFPVAQMIKQPKNWCTDTWWFPKHIKCPPLGQAMSFHYVPLENFEEYYWWAYRYTQVYPPSKPQYQYNA